MAGVDWSNWWDWTYEDITQLVESHQFEPGRFDFKATIKGDHGNRNDLRNGIRQTACGMANSETGGRMIFGVLDQGTMKSPAERVIGFQGSADLRKELGNVLNGIQPAIQFDTSPKPIHVPNSKTVLFVADIPSSLDGPHMTDGRFLVRTAGGSNVEMNWEQISNRMRFNHERCASLVRLRVLLALLEQDMARISNRGGLTFAARQTVLDTDSLRSAVGFAAVAIYYEADLFAELHKVMSAADTVNDMIRFSLRPQGPNPWAVSRFDESSGIVLDDAPHLTERLDRIIRQSGCRFSMRASQEHQPDQKRIK